MEKKVALVTGASRGIGRQISLTLAKEGMFVIVNYCGSEARAKGVLEEIRENGGDGCIYQCDVADYQQTEAMARDLIKTYGHVDVLVNNAGITRDNLILRMSEEEFDAVVETNLKGCFHTIRHLSRYFLKQRSGKIINIASVSGVLGNAGQAPYPGQRPLRKHRRGSWQDRGRGYHRGSPPDDRHPDSAEHRGDLRLLSSEGPARGGVQRGKGLHPVSRSEGADTGNLQARPVCHLLPTGRSSAMHRQG